MSIAGTRLAIYDVSTDPILNGGSSGHEISSTVVPLRGDSIIFPSRGELIFAGVVDTIHGIGVCFCCKGFVGGAADFGRSRCFCFPMVALTISSITSSTTSSAMWTVLSSDFFSLSCSAFARSSPQSISPSI